LPPVLLMVDLSSNNAAPDLAKHYEGGHRVIALKATEGTSYTWDQHGRLADEWHKLGGAVWHYHFARPGDAKTQATRLLNAVGTQHWHAGDRIVLDAEASGVTAAFVRTFIATCYLNRPNWSGIVYSYSSFLIAAKIKPTHGWGLWLAAYQSTEPKPAPGWARLTAWQFTDKQSGLPGISGAVDCSHLLDPGVVPAEPVRAHPLSRRHRRWAKRLTVALGKRTQPITPDDRKTLAALDAATLHALGRKS
jgi:YD repeat-containing protein